MKYLTQLAIALTQGLNALTGGYADESTSSRAHRQQYKARWRFTRRVINTIFFWQTDHCLDAYIAETERRHTPPCRRG